jgi:hypothetical protein
VTLSALLLPQVLKHLTVKRPVDASRMDFFAQAEAFAALVNMEFVSITGEDSQQKTRFCPEPSSDRLVSSISDCMAHPLIRHCLNKPPNQSSAVWRESLV